nr:immunoglobulin heavy chain junction region [Macaca mulatta]
CTTVASGSHLHW